MSGLQSIKDIKIERRRYTINGRITEEPKYIETERTTVLSFIIKDGVNDKIEVVGFNEIAERQQHLIIADNVIEVQNATAVANVKHARIKNNRFKLQLEHNSKIVTRNNVQYFKNNKICIEEPKANKKKKPKLFSTNGKKAAQTSIKNWLRYK